MTSVSNTTQAVLNTISAIYFGDSKQDPATFYKSAQCYTSNASASAPSLVAGTINTTFTATSGFMAPIIMDGKQIEFKTYTTVVPNVNGSTTVPNTGIFQIPTNGDWSLPYVGDFPPNGIWTSPTPNLPGTGKIEFVPYPVKPDLEQLEEGVHDIKGGKVIIKKIKITEEQLDEALEEVVGHEPTDIEKQQLRDELELIATGEEREV